MSGETSEIKEPSGIIENGGLVIDVAMAKKNAEEIFGRPVIKDIRFAPLQNGTISAAAAANPSKGEIYLDDQYSGLFAANFFEYFEMRSGINLGFKESNERARVGWRRQFNLRHPVVRAVMELFTRATDRYRNVWTSHDNQDPWPYLDRDESWQDFFDHLRTEYEGLMDDGQAQKAHDLALTKLNTFCGYASKFVKIAYAADLTHEAAHIAHAPELDKPFIRNAGKKMLIDMAAAAGLIIASTSLGPEMARFFKQFADLVPAMIVGGSYVAIPLHLFKEYIRRERRDEFLATESGYYEGKIMKSAVSVTDKFWEAGFQRLGDYWAANSFMVKP